MLWLLLAVLILGPVLEITVLVLAVREIGGWWVLGLLVFAAFAGAWLTRREGVRAWRSAREAVNAGRVPAAEVTDGLLVLAGGLLLLAPGFLSDVVGLLALLPPTRRLLRGLLLRVLGRRLPGPVADTVLGPRMIRARRVTTRRAPTSPVPHRPVVDAPAPPEPPADKQL